MLNKIQEELQYLRKLMQVEKEEDLKQYKEKILEASLEQRQKEGLCWFPVNITGQQFSLGEKVIVQTERTGNTNQPHAFQNGKLVSLFGLKNNQKNARQTISGVVNQVKGNTMTITLNISELPEWIFQSSVGIDLLFDDASYKEMDLALKTLINTRDEKIIHLMSILLGEEIPEFKQDTHPKITHLNESQNQALQMVLNAGDVAIIHGPPGTGKTTTLVEAIKSTLTTEQQVLVCAPSNAAVDLLAEKLHEAGLNILRLGHPARVNETTLKNTLDAKMAGHQHFKDLKELRHKAGEYKKLGLKYRRKYGPAEKAQRKKLLQEASQVKREAEHLEFYIMNDIFQQARVITTTLVGASHPWLNEHSFHTVFIDEAAQALEAASWIPIMRARRVIFAGDHYQLPPTVKSYEAEKQGLGKTLFEKSRERKEALGSKVDTMLKLQYRMHEKIMHFSSDYFYKGQLQADASVKNHTLFPGDNPLLFIDTAGSGYIEETDPETKSTFNKEEGLLMLHHLNNLLTNLGSEKINAENLQIGVIAPYKAQIKSLMEQMESFPLFAELQEHITVDTIDAFQGRERDVIYISFTRSNNTGEIGFLKEVRRINVAMTRARKKLVMIGDSATLGSHPFYERLLDYVQEEQSYQSAFELMHLL